MGRNCRLLGRSEMWHSFLGSMLQLSITIALINHISLQFKKMLVSSQPYLKTYLFPFWSLGTLIRVGMLVLAVVLPFFMTYSTPQFFLASRLEALEQSITYNYNYHISITTTNGKYLYTNLYQQPTSMPPTLTEQNSKSVMQFSVQWFKPPSENVKSIEIALFFTFKLNGVSNFASAQAKVDGYSLSQVSIAGPLSIVNGSGSSPLTASALALSGFDLATFSQTARKSSAYLQYDYSALPLNFPSDFLTVTMVLNYSGLLGLQTTPSILGQLVWSWIQYFPIFLSLFWALDKMFSFLVREQVIGRKVVHDPEYVKMTEEEKSTKLHR